MSVRCVGIHWNSTKHDGLTVARRLIDMLAKRHVDLCVNGELSRALECRGCLTDAFERCDVLIVLGGDGTILSALDRAIPYDIPILGVNLGRLGFLTQIETGTLTERLIDRVLSGDYDIDQRAMLAVEGQDPLRVFALNDVVITRSAPAVHVLSLEYRASGSLIDRVSGDGLIVATATGSTAYSLSAGGPVVLPGLGCFVLTPVCPHTLNARPVVVSDNERITVRLCDDRGGAQAVFDGRKQLALNAANPEITVFRSSQTAKFIRLEERNYYSLLRSKLSEWTH